MLICWLFGALGFFGVVLAPINPLPMYSINEVKVTGSVFVSQVPAAILLVLVTFGAACLTVAYGLLAERTWSRDALLGTVSAVLLIGVFGEPADAVTMVFTFSFAMLLVGALALYLYRKSNVVAYFQRLERGPGGEAAV